MSEERLRKALAVALHECLPDTADDRMHPTGEDADEPFCEYLSHALIARITEPTWLAQNDLPGAAAQADTAPVGGLREAVEAWADAKGEAEAHDERAANEYRETGYRLDEEDEFAAETQRLFNALVASEDALRAALAAPSREAGLDVDDEYHEHVAGDKHSHSFSGPHSHGGVSALSYPRDLAADLARWLQDSIESQPAITIRSGVEPQVAWRALADELLRRWGK